MMISIWRPEQPEKREKLSKSKHTQSSRGVQKMCRSLLKNVKVQVKKEDVSPSPKNMMKVQVKEEDVLLPPKNMTKI